MTLNLAVPLAARLDAHVDSGRFMNRSEALRHFLALGLDAAELGADGGRREGRR